LSVLALRDSTNDLSRYAKLERNMGCATPEKFGNIHTPGLAMKDVAFLTYDMSQKLESHRVRAGYAHGVMTAGQSIISVLLVAGRFASGRLTVPTGHPVCDTARISSLLQECGLGRGHCLSVSADNAYLFSVQARKL
jgi:hypothetical protein